MTTSHARNRWAVWLAALLGGLTAPASLAVTSPAADPPGYAAWAEAQGLPDDQRGWQEAPAGDGVPNLLKFASGWPALQPVDPAAWITWTADPATGSLRFTFRKSRSAESVNLLPAWSWQGEEWRTGGYGLRRVAEDQTGEIWEASLPLGEGLWWRLLAEPRDGTAVRPRFPSPFALAFSPDGGRLAATDREGGLLEFWRVAGEQLLDRLTVSLHGEPTGLVWIGQDRVMVAETGAGTLAEVVLANGSAAVARRIPAGAQPQGLAWAPGRRRLVVGEVAWSEILLLDYDSGQVQARLPGPRDPGFVAVTPDERWAVAASGLPAGPALGLDNAAHLTLVDLAQPAASLAIPLPAGSSNVRQVRVSPDGHYAYAGHTLGNVALPTTQLDRGWVNTNALSILDLGTQRCLATLLLDSATRGAADPWGLDLSADGKTAWISLAGVHEVARLDLGGLHDHLSGHARARARGYSPGAVWPRLWAGEESPEDLAYHFTALESAGVLTRREVPVRGPRGVALSPDGTRLAVAGYYSGRVLLLQASTLEVLSEYVLDPDATPDAIRRGEEYFHDGTLSFQGWLSCATCHPGGRADGLNWDLPNDGLGTPKNTKSLVGAAHTPPTTWLGVRSGAHVSVAAGFLHIHFRAVPAEVADSTEAYLNALRPAANPYRRHGRLSPAALQGRALFESPAVGCAECHHGRWGTDLERYDVGTQAAIDQRPDFDNPSLVELWRTAPFLHDGRAETLADLLTLDNPGDRHGRTAHLTAPEREALVAYLLSL